MFRDPTRFVPVLVVSILGIAAALMIVLRSNSPFAEQLEDRIYINEEAKRRFHFLREKPEFTEDHWMTLAMDCYLFDGGNFNGSIKYWSCTLPSKDKCFEALRDTAEVVPSEEQFRPWGHSNYLVVMNGPGHYHPHYKTELWDVNTIKNGIFCEAAEGSRRMSFWAIDLDRNRLYYHYESGGFPDDRYEPK